MSDKCPHELFSRYRFARPCGCNYLSQIPNWSAIYDYQSLAAIPPELEEVEATSVEVEQLLPPLQEMIPKEVHLPPPLAVPLPAPPLAVPLSAPPLAVLPPPPLEVLPPVAAPSAASAIPSDAALTNIIPPSESAIVSAIAVEESSIESTITVFADTIKEQSLDAVDEFPAADALSNFKRDGNVPGLFERNSQQCCEEENVWLWTAAAVLAIGFSAYLFCKHQIIDGVDSRNNVAFHHQSRKKSKKQKSKLVLETQKAYHSE